MDQGIGWQVSNIRHLTSSIQIICVQGSVPSAFNHLIEFYKIFVSLPGC